MIRLLSLLFLCLLSFAGMLVTASFCHSQPSPPSTFAHGIANPSMGIGLNGISYWGPNFPFIDLMKQASGGEMHPDSSAPSGSKVILFDAMEAQNLLDTNGWPTRLPKHYYWTSIVTADAEKVPSQKGRYLVKYKGTGQVKVVTNGRILSEVPGEIRFEVSSDEIYIQLMIQSSDPYNRGDYIRDIVVIQEKNLELYQAGQIFNPQWLDLVKDMRVLRFMDWQFTNGSIESQWSERSTLSTLTWGVTLERKTQKGVPLEAMITLANQTGTDPWFNLPFHADDDYIRKFSAYVAEHLDPELSAYFEYSNEVWNWIFQQTGAAQNAGLEFFEGKFGEYPLRQYYGYRSAEVSHIVHQAFGPEAKERLHFTLATQTDDNNYPLLTSLQGAEIYAKQHKQRIVDLFKSVAVTWYFNIPAELDKQVAQWIDQHGEARAIDMLFEQLTQQQLHFNVPQPADQPSIEKTIHHVQIQAKLAQQYKLDTISYEGGTHLLGYEEYNERLASFFIRVNEDKRMGKLYEQILQGWNKIPGTTLLNHFVEVGNHSRWGSWGALRHLEDSSARWDFIVAANNTPKTWEKRSPTAFDQGVIRYGDKNANTLQGSSEEDFLIGKSGNDTLIGGENNDGLHGGQGDDKLFGGPGNDVLVGGQGNDLLSGGPGRDRFVFTSQLNEIDTITDFDDLDLIDIRPILYGANKNSRLSDYLSIKHLPLKHQQLKQSDHKENRYKISIQVDRDGAEKKYSPETIAYIISASKLDLNQLTKSGRVLFF